MKEIQKEAWKYFENSDGIFFVIKTEKKEIAFAIPSKFENTEGMEVE